MLAKLVLSVAAPCELSKSIKVLMELLENQDPKIKQGAAMASLKLLPSLPLREEKSESVFPNLKLENPADSGKTKIIY